MPGVSLVAAAVIIIAVPCKCQQFGWDVLGAAVFSLQIWDIDWHDNLHECACPAGVRGPLA